MNEYLKADTRKIILGYKIQYRLGAIIREIEDRGYSKYYFVRFARNLIWALTIQGLLNDDEIDSFLENYGRSLSVEADFNLIVNLIVKHIGSKRIRVILSELIKQKKYEELINEEKYSSLKIRIAFQDCMNIAKKRFGWEMLSLTRS
ncbi:MAG TPA: hypothetical protein VNJ07_05390 [Chitinophagales bacterium]|nr:hypothetical protein [Chitinophagales bacterium]